MSDPLAIESILSRFLRRAWRRPVSEEEVKTWQAHYESHFESSRTHPSQALKETLSAALASSHFLYLSEPFKSEKPRKLNSTMSWLPGYPIFSGAQCRTRNCLTWLIPVACSTLRVLGRTIQVRMLADT